MSTVEALSTMTLILWVALLEHPADRIIMTFIVGILLSVSMYVNAENAAVATLAGFAVTAISNSLFMGKR